MKNKSELFPIEKIKPVEKVFPYHLKILKELILKDGYIKNSIIIDDEYNIVLDGSHRHIALCQLGCEYIPVIKVNYNSPDIRVGTNLIHRYLVDEPIEITKKEIIKRGTTGNLFPPRTTRHFFPFRKNDNIKISLNRLGVNKKYNIDNNNIVDCDIQNEINSNKKYLKEIDMEMLEISHYIDEILHTRMYLSDMVDSMEKTRYEKR